MNDAEHPRGTGPTAPFDESPDPEPSDNPDGDKTPSVGRLAGLAAREVKRRLVGDAQNPLDPHLFHQLSLIAFFAWVGLGADGLSSSCYGPEEAFRAIGEHHGLAVLLALATVITVTIISAGYFQVIDLFPNGGGGYLVGTKLLGRYAGLVSGTALVVDYALTVATSVASGMDAMFSLLPPWMHGVRAPLVFVGIIGLTTLNLRGVKESIKILTPIFLLFVVTHVILIATALFGSPSDLVAVPRDTAVSLSHSLTTLGLLGTMGVFFRAYSLGAGTYTGIEAVSNGLSILREPRQRTGKRTMMYMAISLSVTAGGLLLAYLIHHTEHQAGQTLNATLARQIMLHWHLGPLPVGPTLVVLTLVSEAAILLVAAQTGFVDGPRVLANMALDQWIPRRFANLSERLVTQDGILLMGGLAVGMLLYTHTRVGTLLIMYSINVFITFVLTQAGMVRHWWEVRKSEKDWWNHIWINGVGLLLCAGILIVTVAEKFTQGGWVTLLITGAGVSLCILVHRHYGRIRRYTDRLDAVLTALPLRETADNAPAFDTRGPTAVILVSGYNGLGIHSLLSVMRLFPHFYKNLAFIEVGVVDFERWKGAEEVANLKATTERDLQQYVHYANNMGLWATARLAFGTEVIDAAADVCLHVSKELPRCTFFAGRMIYLEENFGNRALHGQTALALQRRLHFAGQPFIILPIRAMEVPGSPANLAPVTTPR